MWIGTGRRAQAAAAAASAAAALERFADAQAGRAPLQDLSSGGKKASLEIRRIRRCSRYAFIFFVYKPCPHQMMLILIIGYRASKVKKFTVARPG
jgi:hypothetical protein